MATRNYAEAIWDAIREEMRQDPRVIVLGQDVEMNLEAKKEFGSRIRNTPISETGFIGAGIGAALTGMRPIIELGCSTFLYSAMDQVINQAAKSRYMFGGQANVPLVIRAPVLSRVSAAAHHADRPWGLFAHAPGLKIVAPATPTEAKGMLKSAIRDGNPVLYFEEMTLGSRSENVPDTDYTVPIGSAAIKREGHDVTIVTLASSVHHSLEAASIAADKGISAEIIDIRTVVPLDYQTILESIRRTGRLIVVDSAPQTCGVAAEISCLAAEHAFESLKAPIIRLAAPDVPVPYSPALEELMYPTVEGIASAILRLVVKPSRTSALRAFA